MIHASVDAASRVLHPAWNILPEQNQQPQIHSAINVSAVEQPSSANRTPASARAPNDPSSDGGTAGEWKLCRSLGVLSKQFDRRPVCNRPPTARLRPAPSAHGAALGVCGDTRRTAEPTTGLPFDQAVYRPTAAPHQSDSTGTEVGSLRAPLHLPQHIAQASSLPRGCCNSCHQGSQPRRRLTATAPSPLQLFTGRQCVLTGGR